MKRNSLIFNVLLAFLLAVISLNVQAQRPFVTVWKIDKDDLTLTIPVDHSLNYLFEVDWDNDGHFEDVQVNREITHIYEEPGTYEVAIRGVYPKVSFSTPSSEVDVNKLRKIVSWGDIEWLSFKDSFRGCTQLRSLGKSKPNLSMVQDMSGAFAETRLLQGDIGYWDVSNVRNMSEMFMESGFRGDLSHWDVSNVEDMSFMFCRSDFNGDLSKWEIPKVMNMESMFEESSFHKDISSWNVSKVKSMKNMFRDTKINCDIGSWDVSSVEDMAGMFCKNKAFEYSIALWDVSHVKDMSQMFQQTHYLGDISQWDVSNVTNMSGMFAASKFDGDLSKWNVSHVQDMSKMFAGAYFNGDISSWDVSQVINMSGMFGACYSLKDLPLAFTKRESFEDKESLVLFPGRGIFKLKSRFSGDISSWNVSKVQDMSKMFIGNPNNYNLEKWDVSNVTNMYGMFSHSSFNGKVRNWNVGNVRDMSCMFSCSLFNRDVSSWNVSNVNDMSYMFEKSDFAGDVSSWDVSNVYDLSNMFKETRFCGKLSEWNVSNVTDMSGLFWSCEFRGDISSWDVTKVTSMKKMFVGKKLDSGVYDRILISWSKLDLRHEVEFGGGRARCSSSEAKKARKRLREVFNWKMVDRDYEDKYKENLTIAMYTALLVGPPTIISALIVN